MGKQTFSAKAALSLLVLIILILDSKTAMQAAREGIVLCLNTAIPSLFPAMVISEIFVKSIDGKSNPVLCKFLSLFPFPAGSEPIFISGLFGGYPTGARLIGLSFYEKKISKKEAETLLQFCSNAGPAFIWGICGPIFISPFIPTALWLIHIISAIFTVACLCRQKEIRYKQQTSYPLSVPIIISNCVKSMGVVCGWIVLFRIVICFFQKWFLWLLPPAAAAIFSGILELTNGCISLNLIQNDGLRFICCSFMLALGGICVTMQTASFTKGLSIKPYIKGKLTQSLFSVLFSSLFLTMSHFTNSHSVALLSILLIGIILLSFINAFKKNIAFPKNVVYNTEKAITR